MGGINVCPPPHCASTSCSNSLRRKILRGSEDVCEGEGVILRRTQVEDRNSILLKGQERCISESTARVAITAGLLCNNIVK